MHKALAILPLALAVAAAAASAASAESHFLHGRPVSPGSQPLPMDLTEQSEYDGNPDSDALPPNGWPAGREFSPVAPPASPPPRHYRGERHPHDLANPIAQSLLTKAEESTASSGEAPSHSPIDSWTLDGATRGDRGLQAPYPVGSKEAQEDAFFSDAPADERRVLDLTIAPVRDAEGHVTPLYNMIGVVWDPKVTLLGRVRNFVSNLLHWKLSTLARVDFVPFRVEKVGSTKEETEYKLTSQRDPVPSLRARTSPLAATTMIVPSDRKRPIQVFGESHQEAQITRINWKVGGVPVGPFRAVVQGVGGSWVVEASVLGRLRGQFSVYSTAGGPPLDRGKGRNEIELRQRGAKPASPAVSAVSQPEPQEQVLERVLVHTFAFSSARDLVDRIGGDNRVRRVGGHVRVTDVPAGESSGQRMPAKLKALVVFVINQRLLS